jgi:phage terminase large subunit-like protein
LVDVKIWKPQGGKAELELVESAIIDAHQRYRLASIAIDPWQAEMLRQRLQKRGLPVRDVSFTGPNLQAMASAVMDSFRERTIDLYDHRELLADLKNLRIVERSYGYRLEPPKGNAQEGTRHGDTATALSLAMFAAKRFTNHRTSNLNRELVCYPGR